MRPRSFAKPGLVILSLVLVFTICELSLRSWDAFKARRGEMWALYDEELGYRLNPAFGDISDDGLRDHPVGAKAGRFRILMLGDSIAYNGDHIDDTWVGQLRLDPRMQGKNLDVVNAAVRGYTNYQELLYLKRDGLRLRPDLVGIGFVLNDLHRFLTVFQVEDGKIVRHAYDFSPDAVNATGSALYRTLRKSVFLVWLRRRLEVVEASTFLSAGQGYSFDYRPDFLTAWQNEPWLDIEEQLAEMSALGRTHGFGLFLVAFPFGDQYDEHYLKRDRKYVLKPQIRLAEICIRHAIPMLDLYTKLDPEQHLQKDKIHLNAKGRGFVADTVAEFLLGSGLLPTPGGDTAP